MNLGLEGKTVLITGSTSGIGRETARHFLAEGARVVVNGPTDEETDRAVAELAGSGEVRGVAADLSTANGVAELAAAAQRQKPLDILVNNVGVYSVKPFEELTDEDWLDILNLNVMSAVRLCRSVLPAMLQRGSGAILNIASEAGVKPLPQLVHYSVSKTAMIGLTRGCAELTKGSQVRVNSVLPGPTWTEGVQRYFAGLAAADGRPLDEIVANYFRNEEPTSLIQRFIQPSEVAQLIVFISANQAMNGGAYRVEGGIIRSIL
jgi:NAD(P)-dependent dehydrogenase (short-subunit alcohol dehydrogenase family)